MGGPDEAMQPGTSEPGSAEPAVTAVADGEMTGAADPPATAPIEPGAATGQLPDTGEPAGPADTGELPAAEAEAIDAAVPAGDPAAPEPVAADPDEPLAANVETADASSPLADVPAPTVADPQPSGVSGFPRRKSPNDALLSGRYRLDALMATGGMGEVWRATDEQLDRPVAVKLLSARHAADEQFRTRFRAEARYAASLSHPGIAQVFDYGESGADGDGAAPRAAYLVMELVEGEALSATIARDAPMPAATVLDLVAQAARALAVAHAAGIVHRDIKPGNLLIRPDGQVKITDFGIARAAAAAKLTQTGVVMGTAQYVSPEQASARPVTAASDIYSLGVVAYECLAGQPPFTADAPIALALAHVSTRPPALPPSVPPQVAALVGQMLAKEPADRPASAAVVADRAKALHGAAPVGPPPGDGDGDGDSPWIIGSAELANPAAWFSDSSPTTPVPHTGTAPMPGVPARRTGSRRLTGVFAVAAVLIAILTAGTIAMLAAYRHPAATAPGRSAPVTHRAKPRSKSPAQTPDSPATTTFPAQTQTPSGTPTPDTSPSPTGSPSTSLSPTSSPSTSTSPPTTPPTTQSTPPTTPPTTQSTEQGILRIPNTIMQDG